MFSFKNNRCRGKKENFFGARRKSLIKQEKLDMRFIWDGKENRHLIKSGESIFKRLKLKKRIVELRKLKPKIKLIAQPCQEDFVRIVPTKNIKVKPENVYVWMKNEGMNVQKIAEGRYVFQNKEVSLGVLLLHANRIRLKKGLLPFFLEEIAEY